MNFGARGWSYSNKLAWIQLECKKKCALLTHSNTLGLWWLVVLSKIPLIYYLSQLIAVIHVADYQQCDCGVNV